MDDLLQQGITAYKAGKREDARKIFVTVVKRTPDSELAWGWMYQTSGNDRERIYCLKQMLRINPKNEKTGQLLSQLVVPPPPIHVDIPKVVTRKCPHCNAENQIASPRCSYCGREINEQKSALPKKADGGKINPIIPLLGIMIAIIVCGVIYSMSLQAGKKLVTPPTPTRSPEETAWYACTRFVEEQMKTSMIDAQSYTPNGVTLLDNGQYRVDVGYAKLSTTYTCILRDRADGRWELISLGAVKN